MLRETDSPGQAGGIEPAWRKCADCGRQFRVEASPQVPQPRYCPVCDYRRVRRTLDQLNPRRGEESETEGESE